ncbi:MAG TPA: GNAT family N-acetyltransferase [Usitatibacteraceae bacterium]|nr:GNAT family N-acetyltransferase [Usitatibacteraceae bacterium]
MTEWRFARLDELTAREVHDILQARAAVFVVEQACVFQDMDGADPDSWHLFTRVDGELAAYCRIVPAGIKFAEPSIGRVITTGAMRGTGLGRALMLEALRRSATLWPGAAIRIGAQRRLETFYHSLGFVTDSEPYDEDGIAHVEMVHTGEGT